ncbi:MAG: thioredoxin family protein [Acidobacteria bacterium]|nr:thioredoxin family protein [Acidobacteriota bacterium]
MLRSRIAALRLAIIFWLLAAALPGDAAEDSIYWFKDLKQASEAAQRADLPMFIDFWADWCVACKIMDADVYTDSRVIEAFQSKIVGVRVHFDMQQELARKYNVPALPFLVFTNSYGTPLLYHRGFLAAEDLSKVADAMPPLAEINRLDRILQKDKDHFETLVAMGQALRTASFYETSNTYYERAAKRNEAKKDAAQRESILFAMGSNWLMLRDGKQAAEMFERCLKGFPKSERRPDFLLGLGRAYILDEKKDKGRRALHSVIAEFPQSQAARTAQELLTSL